MPRVRLTALNVGKLKAKGGRRDYRDTLLPGLVLRVTPTGIRTWVVEYHVDGDGGRQGKRKLLGHFPLLDLGDARAEARSILKALDRGAGLPRGAGVLTVARLVERCLADITLRPTTRKEWERLLRVEIAPALGKIPAGELRRADVRAWVATIKARSGWTATRAFELLRRACSWGLREELLEASPCDRMPKPFEGAPSERVLSAEELWAVQRAVDRARGRGRGSAQGNTSGYADATRLLLLTAVRRAAVLGMRREELEGLDGQDPRWIVPGGLEGRSKSGRAHVVPLVPAALEVVRRRLDDSAGQHLFPIGRERTGDDDAMTWSRSWVTWLRRRVEGTLNARRRRAGLPRQAVPRWTIHNLRHSVATHMREDLGVAPDIVSLLLGHTIPGASVTRVYDRSQRLGERRAALLAWTAWLAALGGAQEAGRVLPFKGGKA
jgi:integrase